jgi:hypothetical protein
VPAGVSGDLDRAGAGELQHPQRLALAPLAWAGQLLAAECLAAGPDRVQGVALGLGATSPLGSVDLDHPLAMIGQEAGQPSAVAARPLQRPAAATGRSVNHIPQ